MKSNQLVVMQAFFLLCLITSTTANDHEVQTVNPKDTVLDSTMAEEIKKCIARCHKIQDGYAKQGCIAGCMRKAPPAKFNKRELEGREFVEQILEARDYVERILEARDFLDDLARY
ncbi:hypothetical protein CPB83DRAFT_884057 [Crepidotus variabilis]|uniref:Uncharacterized protein n=1 Tax=Crepidotus variabilis TaxID=179855 RepID=A0A9P6EDV4_9AGAR|nr:hypothetical protein CPB83DRAFT_884057 [Crepidotus variabilis]